MSTLQPDPVIDTFVDALWLEDGLSRLTLDAYRRDLNGLSRWAAAQGQNLATCDTTALQAYFAEQHAQTRATSVNRRLSVFKRFYRWALRERIVQADPTLQLLSAKTPLRVPKSLTEHQVELLLAAPNVDTPLGLRDRTMIELMYASGLRVSELVGLPVHAVSLNDGALRVLGKGSMERLIPFGEVALDWLQRYLASARPGILKGQQTDALFVTQRGAGMSRVAFWMIV